VLCGTALLITADIQIDIDIVVEGHSEAFGLAGTSEGITWLCGGECTC